MPAAPSAEHAGDLLKLLGTDWSLAVLLAALDDTGGDLDEAITLARQALADDPDGPGEGEDGPEDALALMAGHGEGAKRPDAAREQHARLGEAIAYLRGAGMGDTADEVLRYWTQDTSYRPRAGSAAGTKGVKKWVEEGKKPRYQVNKPGEGRKAGVPMAPRRPGQPKAPKPTAADLAAWVATLRGNPASLTPQVADALAADILSLTVKERDAWKRSAGMRVGGTKDVQARELARRIIAQILAKAGVPSGRAAGQPVGRAGGDGDVPATPGDGRPVAPEAGGPGTRGADQAREDASEPAGKATPRSVPATTDEVNRRLDRYGRLFRSRGQGQAADWVEKLRAHVEAVGTDAALAALGEEVQGEGIDGVQYEGVWGEDVAFVKSYLDRFGIEVVGDEIGNASDPGLVDASRPVVSSVARSQGGFERPDTKRGRKQGARDFLPADPTLADKLAEAKALPGLESSEDLGKLLGQQFGTVVSEFSPDVLGKLDETYGEGKWIVKAYGDEAAAGYGIFFPQRVAQLNQDARNKLWASGESLARHGFEHVRDDASEDGFAAAIEGKADTVDEAQFVTGPNVGGQEQDVYYDERNDRYNKIAKRASGQNDTQEEFLVRHQALNAIWPELGYKFQGLTQDGRPIISANAIGGEEPSAQEVDDWLWNNDWEPYDDPDSTRGSYDVSEAPDQWRNRRTGVVIGDTHQGNWKKQANGELVPIDIDLTPGDPGMYLGRQKHQKVIGVKGPDGSVFRFGSPKYQGLYGDVREAADQASQVAGNEAATAIPKGRFMAQPAFDVVGISDEERAQGVTFKTGQEGRVHIVTRNGRAEVVPYSTWLKNEHLPVVFESEDTRAMARAAQEAIDALPESDRMGQTYAPDIVRTADGYRVVEANPSNHSGGSGYLTDNPFTIDSYVSHLTGREPAHVKFIRKLLTSRKRGGAGGADTGAPEQHARLGEVLAYLRGAGRPDVARVVLRHWGEHP